MLSLADVPEQRFGKGLGLLSVGDMAHAFTYVTLNPAAEVATLFEIAGVSGKASFTGGTLAILGDTERSTEVQLNGLDSRSFLVKDQANQLFDEVGLGIEAQLDDQLILSAGFDGLLSGDQQVYMGGARLSFLFQRTWGPVLTQAAPPRETVPMLEGYIICSTARSGSTLLCNLLTSTKRAGEPDSFYRRQSIASWAEYWRLPHSLGREAFERVYLAAAIKAGRAGTPLFGMRLMRENLEELSEILDRLFPRLPSDRARLETAFGKLLFIHLSRADKLAQAISLVKAEQTGLWHIAPDGREIERLAPPAEPHYDFERIRQVRRALEAFDTAWRTWFAEQGISPLSVRYETLATDPAATLIRICQTLGIEAPVAAAVTPGVARLADATSREWLRRYQADLGAGRSCL